MFVRCRSMRIVHRLFAVIGVLIGRPGIDPAGIRHIGHPPVCGADMIIYRVLNYFHSAGMDRVDKAVVGSFTAKALIDPVMIGDPVAMITAQRTGSLLFTRHIVFSDRGKPDTGYAPLL